MGQTSQSTTINAPADKVWATLRSFHHFSWAPNVITKCEAVGDVAADQPGAKRLLNDAFHETLIKLNDGDRILRYSIDDGPSPISKDDVSHYIGIIHVHSVTDTDTTFVEWTSSWEKNDEAAQEFCHGIYVALLGELKNHFA